MSTQRDLSPEDFPFTIVVHSDLGVDDWRWAVTLLRPPRGEQIKLYVPATGPGSWVSTWTGEGVTTTTGPYGGQS